MIGERPVDVPEGSRLVEIPLLWFETYFFPSLLSTQGRRTDRMRHEGPAEEILWQSH